jgi:hypothetical protein
LRGAYSVTASFAGDSGHTGSTSDAQPFSVYQPTVLSVSTSGTAEVGQPLTLTAMLQTLGGGVPIAGESVSFAAGGASIGTVTTDPSGIATLAFVPSTAQPYTITATFLDAANFYTDDAGAIPPAAETAGTSVTVAAIPVSVTVTGSQTYGGSATFTVSGGLPSGVQSTGTLACASVNGGTAIAPTLAAGGSYTIDGQSCTGLSGDATHALTVVGGALVVAQAPLTITASSPSMTYGGTVPAIAASYAGFVNNEGAGALAQLPTCATTATSTSPVAQYGTSCSGAVAGNYSIGYLPGTLTVNPAPLAITASSGSFTFGGTPPAIVAGYAGFVAGDTAGSLTTKPACSTTATSTSPVGSYGSSCSGAVDGNYAITYVGGSVAVTPASLTITASGGSFGYGGTPPTITPSYAGFVAGNTAASLTTKPTCSSTATPTSPVGSYPSSCSGAVDANYSIAYVAGTVTVTRVPLTITASSPTLQYGQAIVITAGYSGFVAGDTSSSLTTKPTCRSTAPASGAPGTYTTSCSGAVDSNYVIRYVTGKLTITKAGTTLTASPVKVSLLRLTYSAKLTRTFDGTLIAGRTVTFTIGRSTVCTATTNAQGVASCTVFGLILGIGPTPAYTAKFGGDADYLASTGTAAL